VLAAVAGKPTVMTVEAEKQIDFFSRGIGSLIAGAGFLIVSGVSFAISIRLAVLGVFALAFAFVFLGGGIARLVRARGLRKLRESSDPRRTPELSPGDADYIKPGRSIYATDELTAVPGSVTEKTTSLLDKK
jgi:hypothetical protein